MDNHVVMAAVYGSSGVTMGSKTKDINLDVEGRHQDVRIGIEGKEHGEISFSVQRGGVNREPYEGPYAVASFAHEIQLYNTENKVMTENLIVLPIPYYETSNPEGGLTVYIGGD